MPCAVLSWAIECVGRYAMVLGICCALCGTEIGSAGGVRRRPFGYGGDRAWYYMTICTEIVHGTKGQSVPRSGMVLRGTKCCGATRIPSTESRYGATGCVVLRAGTKTAPRNQTRSAAVLVQSVRGTCLISPLSPAIVRRRVPVLVQVVVLRDAQYWARVWCYALCGTELAYAATRREMAFPTRSVSSGRVLPPISYEIYSTDVGYAATYLLRVCGTGLG
eukprot:3683656-Rhodomonas_salina.3